MFKFTLSSLARRKLTCEIILIAKICDPRLKEKEATKPIITRLIDRSMRRAFFLCFFVVIFFWQYLDALARSHCIINEITGGEFVSTIPEQIYFVSLKRMRVAIREREREVRSVASALRIYYDIYVAPNARESGEIHEELHFYTHGTKSGTNGGPARARFLLQATTAQLRLAAGSREGNGKPRKLHLRFNIGTPINLRNGTRFPGPKRDRRLFPNLLLSPAPPLDFLARRDRAIAIRPYVMIHIS